MTELITVPDTLRWRKSSSNNGEPPPSPSLVPGLYPHPPLHVSQPPYHPTPFSRAHQNTHTPFSMSSFKYYFWTQLYFFLLFMDKVKGEEGVVRLGIWAKEGWVSWMRAFQSHNPSIAFARLLKLSTDSSPQIDGKTDVLRSKLFITTTKRNRKKQTKITKKQAKKNNKKTRHHYLTANYTTLQRSVRFSKVITLQLYMYRIYFRQY